MIRLTSQSVRDFFTYPCVSVPVILSLRHHAGLKQCLKPLFSVNYGTVLELFNTNVSLNAEKLSCRSDWGKELSMEGYGRTGEAVSSNPARPCLIMHILCCREPVSPQAAVYGGPCED